MKTEAELLAEYRRANPRSRALSVTQGTAVLTAPRWRQRAADHAAELFRLRPVAVVRRVDQWVKQHVTMHTTEEE